MLRHPVARAGAVLALLAWAPLPFGSVTPAATLRLEIAGFLALAIALLLDRRQPIPAAALRLALAVSAIAGFGLLQSQQWPAWLARTVSAEHGRLADQTAQILTGAPATTIALSLAPDASRRTALLWLLAAAGIVAGAVAGRSRRVRRAICAVLAASAVFQLGYGTPRWMSRATAIWGIEVPNQASRLRGTFVNPNHLATYLLIVAPLLFASLWWVGRRMRSSRRSDTWLIRFGAALLVWLVLFAGLAFTASRAGLLAGLTACAAQLVLLGWKGEHRRLIWGGAGAVALALAYVAYSSFAAGFGRMTQLTRGGGFRVEAMADAFDLWSRFPLLGAGLGAFRAGFPLVHTVGGEGVWWHAHNSWLELAVTTGLPGLVIAAGGLTALVRGLAVSWQNGERSEDCAAALAAIGACVAVGLQELLDFGLTLPANSLTLAVVCGAALAVPRAGSEGASSQPTRDDPD